MAQISCLLEKMIVANYFLQYVMVQCIPGVEMTMAGTIEPCASVKLTSIGMINEELNRSHTTVITEFLERTIKVPRDRYALFLEMTVGNP